MRSTGNVDSGERDAPLTTADWVSYSIPRPRADLRLFCFPYAGGGTSIYRTWSEKLPPTVELCALQLPGRGPRIMERPFTRMTPLVSAVAQSLLPRLDKPFAFFGHSMGALVAFELTRYLRKHKHSLPLQLFISGARAPQLVKRSLPIHTLPKAEFIKKLRRLKGTSLELLEHAELMQLMLPALRADIKICETYVYKKELPLALPISVFGGVQDRQVKVTHLESWQCQTVSAFSLEMLPGNHFFLHASEPLLLPLISHALRHVVKRG